MYVGKFKEDKVGRKYQGSPNSTSKNILNRNECL